MTMLSSRPAATSPLVYPSGLQGYNKDNTIFASSSQPTAAGSFALRSPRAARHVTSLVPGTPTRSQDQLAVDVKALVVQELDRLEVQYKQGSPGFNELNDEDNDEPPRISVLSMARRYTAAAAAAEAEKAKGKQRELETTAPDGGPLFGFGYVRDVVEVWAQGAPGIVETSPWGRVRRVGEPVSGVVVAPADMRPIESFFGEAARA
ncbi:hypothetical protein DFH09DRAFT_1139095 [Mycena vulgaris]|nr:hypothetical protein DFH09DRAFT_1139095 [Mycena vulgaris]